jgi:hypothetical protein
LPAMIMATPFSTLGTSVLSAVIEKGEHLSTSTAGI